MFTNKIPLLSFSCVKFSLMISYEKKALLLKHLKPITRESSFEVGDGITAERNICDEA